VFALNANNTFRYPLSLMVMTLDGWQLDATSHSIHIQFLETPLYFTTVTTSDNPDNNHSERLPCATLLQDKPDKMSTLHTLQSRLKETSNALNETKPLIDRLRNFTHAIGQDDEARLELGAEIHSRLKNVEDEVEILNVEVEGLEVASGQQNKRKTTSDVNGAEKEAEKKRIIGIAERLTGDLRRCVVSTLGLSETADFEEQDEDGISNCATPGKSKRGSCS
jgi:hypothetical protein